MALGGRCPAAKLQAQALTSAASILHLPLHNPWDPHNPHIPHDPRTRPLAGSTVAAAGCASPHCVNAPRPELEKARLFGRRSRPPPASVCPRPPSRAVREPPSTDDVAGCAPPHCVVAPRPDPEKAWLFGRRSRPLGSLYRQPPPLTPSPRRPNLPSVFDGAVWLKSHLGSDVVPASRDHRLVPVSFR
jgi:hypothetical protein